MSDSDNLKIAVNTAYESRRENIVIGLTGITGAGCSTVASILSREKFSDLDLRDIKSWDCRDSSERREYVVNKYMKSENNWQPFHVVEVSGIIISAIFEKKSENFIDYLKKLSNSKENVYLKIADEQRLYDIINGLDFWYGQFQNCDLLKIEEYLGDCKAKKNGDVEKSKIDCFYDKYIEKLPELKKLVQSQLQQFKCYEIRRGIDESEEIKPFNFYTYIMQKIGKNMRASGEPFNEEFIQERIFDFAKRIDVVVKLIRQKYELARICVDAIRNPYEAIYFRDHYKHFYLVAVSADRRNERLENLKENEVRSQDEVENSEKLSSFEEEFFRQDIRKCTEIADIHVHNFTINDGKYYDLTKQLVKYVALILHPGLITPTAIERCMQLAYVAKLNSGCLSRQVGAVVTRPDYSVQAVGWNDVAHGQISCNLRNLFSFCVNKDNQTYSQFEIQNTEFYEAINRLKNKCETEDALCGRCFAYCFKDVYNGIKGEKNQVFTRSLHAEENAFLQISKYGGTGVQGGILFTTASPCELCAKKAYQLGISKIYYIDPYPGISLQHILCFGERGNPEVYNFYGAIGEAYVDLYRPRIALKDELEMLTNINVKKVVKDGNINEQWKFDEIHVMSDCFEIKFTSFCDVSLRRTVKLVLKKGFNNRQYMHDINWTGVVPCGVEVKRSDGCDVKILKHHNPYRICISRKKEVSDEENLCIEYEVLFQAKDADGVMETNIGHRIRYMTDEMQLKIAVPKDAPYVDSVKLIEYADFDMKNRVNEWEVGSRSIVKREFDKKGNAIYAAHIGKSSDTDKSLVNVGHVYVLEWEKKNENNEN